MKHCMTFLVLMATAMMTCAGNAQSLTAPDMTLTVNGRHVVATWNPVDGATGYKLVYGYPGNFPLQKLDLGNRLKVGGKLKPGTQFVVAIEAYNDSEAIMSATESFLINAIDIVEILSEDSDISTITYGYHNNNAVFFTEASGLNAVIFNFTDGSQGVFEFNVDGSTSSFRLLDTQKSQFFSVNYQLRGGSENFSVRSPVASYNYEQPVTDTALSSLSAGCDFSDCQYNELSALFDDADIARVQDQVDRQLGFFNKLAFADPACPSWLKDDVCIPLADYLVEMRDITIKIENRDLQTTARLPNPLNCLVSGSGCSTTAADRVIPFLIEEESFDPEHQLIGGVDIDNSDLTLSRTDWENIVIEHDPDFDEVSCEDSVFFNTRPNCHLYENSAGEQCDINEIYSNGMPYQTEEGCINKWGEKSGEWVLYEDSKPVFRRTYTAGVLNGRYVTYWASGAVKVVANTENDHFEGLYRNFHENGQLASTGTYVNGRKQGTFDFYNPDGTPHHSDEYDNGRKINSADLDLEETSRICVDTTANGPQVVPCPGDPALTPDDCEDLSLDALKSRLIGGSIWRRGPDEAEFTAGEFIIRQDNGYIKVETRSTYSLSAGPTLSYTIQSSVQIAGDDTGVDDASVSAGTKGKTYSVPICVGGSTLTMNGISWNSR